MTEKRIRILIVDDHPLVLNGLAFTLGLEPDMEVAGSASTGPQAVALYRDLRPDVTIMDATLTAEMTGAEATGAIRKEFPDARIVMLSVHKGEEDIYRAMRAGATTYLLKEAAADALAPVIREVHSGGRPLPPDVARKLADRVFQSHLTARETEVLRLIAGGARNKEIAQKLSITENTAQGHAKNILSKLRVTDRTAAVTAAIRRGIFHISD